MVIKHTSLFLYTLHLFDASSLFMHLAETVCTVRSSTGKEVLLGSNFTVSCIFNKPCTKQFFRNNEPIMYEKSPSSSEVFVHIENLTTLSIFTCKCNDNPEPCGIDITPGCKLLTFNSYWWALIYICNVWITEFI